MPERTPASAEVEHQLPGRLRLRIPAKPHDPALFAEIEERLARAPGVRRLRTNPRTGSILIEHAAETAAIAAFAREQGLFDLSPVAAPSVTAPTARRTPRAGRNGPRPLSVAAAGLAGLGAYQVARGRFLGSAVEHLWHAYGAYRRLGMPRLAVALLGLGLYRLAAGPVLSPAVTLLYHAITARAMAAGRASGETASPPPPGQAG